MAKQEKEVEKWVTVNGARVPIFKDGSIGGPKALRDKVKAVVKEKSSDGKSLKDMSATDIGKEYLTATGERKKALLKELHNRGYRRNKDGSWGKKETKDNDTKEKQIARNKAEADERNGKKESPYDETKAKTYKAKGVAGAKKSAEEMTGIKGLQIYEKERTARDTTYELRDKDGHVVGTIFLPNTSRESKLTIYKRKK